MSIISLDRSDGRHVGNGRSELSSTRRRCEAPAPLFERVIDNTFVLEREGRAAKISQVVEATLIYLLFFTVIGGLIFIGSCYALDQINRSQAYTVIDYEYGIRKGQSALSFESFVNNRTVMAGVAGTTWDEDRIINGRLACYRRMGAESVRLNTRTGDQIHGCYFDAQQFHQKLDEHGGRVVNLSIKAHAFLEATPIRLRSTWLRQRSCDGLQISTQAARDEAFQQFCVEQNFTIVQASQFAHSQDGEQYLLIKTADFKDAAYANYEIDTSPTTFNSAFKIFDPERRQIETTVVIDSKVDPSVIQDLAYFGGLKTRTGSFKPGSLRGESVIASKGICKLITSLTKMDYSFLRVEATELPGEQKAQLNKGVVCLSPNQEAGIYHMSGQIFDHLVMGVNVFAHDQAGKGLSRGHNTQAGMTEAVCSAGRFLQEVKGFEQEQILFFGQCSGALPVSEAAKHFPNAHIWIDQAPRNYRGLANYNLAYDLHLDQNGYLATWLTSLAMCVLPSYDVIDNLEAQEGEGLQIYTIGVPNLDDRGGDEVIDEHDQIDFADHLDERGEHGHYLTLPGATHTSHRLSWFPAHQTIHRLFMERLTAE